MDETPQIQCPNCGELQDDFDEFGVLYCEHCQYCKHPSLYGDVCDYCGHTISDELLEPAERLMLIE